MNNLKRVLSLALSGIMLVGMMAMGASAADFSDAADIEHTEAVNVLVALKVINGQDDGSFNPKGDVTRAQMAKMIAVTMNGGSDANTGTKTTPSFTDVKGHWAESYIEYCYDLGIINGRGDGTFDPEGKVTGLEATKMVLTAMGFDAEAYKLTGASWAVRTDEVARTMTGQGWTVTTGSGSSATTTFIPEPNMYDGLGSVLMANNASRDTAAQLIWNGLQNRTRTVQPTTTGDGGVEWTYVTNSTTLLNQRFSANVTTDTFVGNYYTGDCSTKGEIQVGSYKFPADFDISNIGEEVKVIWKDGTRGTKGTLDSKDVIFGVFNTGASRVVTGTLADVKDQKSNKAQINIDGTKYDTADSVEVIVNYANKTDRTAGVLVANGAKDEDATNGSSSGSGRNSDLTNALKFATGDTIKAIIDPDDNEIKTIYVTTAKLAAVTAVNSTKITMNNNVGAITIADNDVEDGLKKGDVVAVSTLYKAKATDDDAYTIVKKAEVVEGEVDGWKESETVTVDGTAYKVYNKAGTFMLTGTAIPDENNVITTFKGTGNDYIEEDVKLYMVNGYVGAAVQTSESASNYSLVTEVKSGVTSSNSVFSGLELQVMDGEGTKSIIKVNKDSAAGDQTANYNVGDIVTYTVGSDGSAKVTKESAFDASAVGAYDDDTKTFGKGTATTLTTSDCVIFIQTKETTSGGEDMTAGINFSGADYKAYKVRDLKTFTSSWKGVNLVTNKDGKVVAAFANLQGTPNGASANTVYGIVTAENGRIKDYYSYTVMSNGETYTVNVDSSTKTLSKGDLVYFDKTNDDHYDTTGSNVVNVVSVGGKTSAVWTKEAETGSLTYYTNVISVNSNWEGQVADQVTKALEKDAPIVYVDTKNDKSDAEGTIGAFDSVNGYANAIIIENNDSPTKIKAVFIETSNEENINGVSGAAPADEAAIKALPDGTHVLGSVDPAISNQPAANLVFFKFTTSADGIADNQVYTLTLTNGTETYTEAGGSYAKDTDHYFVIDVVGATSTGTFSSIADGKFTAGDWTVKVTGADTKVVFTDTLTITR